MPYLADSYEAGDSVWQNGHAAKASQGAPPGSDAGSVPGDELWRDYGGGAGALDDGAGDSDAAAFGWLKKAASSVGRAAVGVVRTAASTAYDTAKAGYNVGPGSVIGLGLAVARGERIDRAAVGALKNTIAGARTLAPYAQAVTSLVPGIGTGVAAGIGAASALAQGARITDAVVAGVRGAIPGGPLAQMGFDAAYGVASGKPLSVVVLDAARSRLPSEAARKAFDVGLAVAQGQNIQQIAMTHGAAAAQRLIGQQVPDLGGVFHRAQRVAPGIAQVLGGSAFQQPVRAAQQQGRLFRPGIGVSGMEEAGVMERIPQLGPTVSRALSSASPVLAGAARPAMSLLSPSTATAARALMRRPDLRALGADALATRLHIPAIAAREAIASVAKTAKAIGTRQLNAGRAGLMPPGALARSIGPTMSLDSALATFGSAMAPKTFTPRPTAARPRLKTLSTAAVNRILALVPAARELHPRTLEAAQRLSRSTGAGALDSSGLVYVVESGDSMGRIAQKLTGSSGRWPELARANPRITDPNKIYPGQRLTLPASWVTTATPAAPPPAVAPPGVTEGRTYTVKSGDTMTSIARAFTGDGRRWPELASSNPRVTDPNKIYVGQRLTIPQSWPTAPGQAGPPPGPGPVAPAAPPPRPPAAIPPPPPGQPRPATPLASTLQVQMMLAGWAKTTGAAVPFDYGTLTDLTGREDGRYQSALASYQRYASSRGEQLRGDGVLDDATYQSLVAWTEAQGRRTTPGAPPGPTPTPGPMPGPAPAPAPMPAPGAAKPARGAERAAIEKAVEASIGTGTPGAPLQAAAAAGSSMAVPLLIAGGVVLAATMGAEKRRGGRHRKRAA